MSRVAVVGVGYWGPNLIRNFLTVPNLDGVIACDQDAAKLHSVASRFPGVECEQNFDDVLARPDVEAVSIATPVRSHYPLAKQALEADKHVLVEKPMTMVVDEAKELVDLADERGLTLMVDHTFLYTGAVEKIAEIVRSGEFGEFYYVDSVRINLGLFQHDVNVIWDLAPHDLSIVNHLVGRRPQVIRAIGQSHTASGLADVAYLNVDYGDNMSANFHVNWLSPTKVRRMIFGGSKRMVLWNDTDEAEKIRVYDRGIEVSAEEADALRVDYRTGDAWLPHVPRTEALQKLTCHFVDCYRTKAQPRTSGRDGLEIVLMLEASGLSLANDSKPVAIEGQSFRLL